jgi:hypothetical protein
VVTPVTFIRDLKKQSWIWRCLLLIGSLIFGTYLVFDVLDLDGSHSPFELSSNTIATLESIQTDAERMSRLDCSTLVDSSQVYFPVIPQVAGNSLPSVIRTLTRILLASHPQILARTHLGPEATSSSSSTGDPA